MPTIAYSLMFYELMHRLEADCQIISLAPPPAPRSPRQDGRFRFDRLQEAAATNRWQWIWSQHSFARDVTAQVAHFRPHIVLNSTPNDPDTYRRKCAATAQVRERLYDRSLSWGSALFRSLMSL